MAKEYLCWHCNKPIIQARVEFLIESGLRESDFTCVKHSQTKRIKGIYSGENGTSDIILCDKVYNDSVRSKFRESAEESEHDSTDNID